MSHPYRPAALPYSGSSGAHPTVLPPGPYGSNLIRLLRDYGSQGTVNCDCRKQQDREQLSDSITQILVPMAPPVDTRAKRPPFGEHGHLHCQPPIIDKSFILRRNGTSGLNRRPSDSGHGCSEPDGQTVEHDSAGDHRPKRMQSPLSNRVPISPARDARSCSQLVNAVAAKSETL
jgi:hypothetical protein